MLKAYTYNPESIGLTAWPSGTLRLEGSTPVLDAAQADVFIVPGNLSSFQIPGAEGVLDFSLLSRLPYLDGNGSRHCFLDVSDNFKHPLNLPCMFIRCDARSWTLQTEPNTLQVAWPVEDFVECVNLPEGGFKYDVSFHGWLSTDARRISSQACLDCNYLKCDIARYPDFCGYIYYEPEGVRRRAEFRRSMKESRVALCPVSIPGVFPYRFFEAMSAGRVACLVGSDFVFPFADEIPYEQFTITIPHAEASTAGERIAQFVRHTSDDELVYMGNLARKSWEKWLNRDDWPRTMTYLVEKHMRKMGLA